MKLSTDETAIIISLISLSVSIVVAIKEYKFGKRSLESEYFNEIFKEHLIRNIPRARKYIRFDSDKLVDIENLVSVLQVIRNDSLYYLYNDKKYYEKLKEACQGLEDYLVNSSQKILIGEEQTEILNELQTKLIDIYKIIDNKFTGKI